MPRRTKYCDSRCENAKGDKCNCWCKGMFHGEVGKEKKQKYIEKYGCAPKTEEQLRIMKKYGKLYKLARLIRSNSYDFAQAIVLLRKQDEIALDVNIENYDKFMYRDLVDSCVNS